MVTMKTVLGKIILLAFSFSAVDSVNVIDHRPEENHDEGQNTKSLKVKKNNLFEHRHPENHGTFRGVKSSSELGKKLAQSNLGCSKLSEVDVEIKTDYWPHEIYWQIKDYTGTIVMACEKKAHGNGNYCYSSKNTLYNDSKDLVACGMEYSFLVRDHYGDGLTTGHYKVSVNGVVVVEGGKGDFHYNVKKFSIGSKFTSYPELKAAVKTWAVNKPWAIQKYGHITDWDVSDITTMRCLFSGYKYCTASGRSDHEMRQKLKEFNEDLSKWDVAKVTNMYGMFDEAHKFNSDISRWDVRKVKTFRYMFFDANSFKQNLCEWDWKHDGNYGWMFHGSGCPVTVKPEAHANQMCFTCYNSGTILMPISIPLDRCFDVQWNPPGHPILKTGSLIKPYKDDYERDGYYTFQINTDGKMSFVRKREDGSIRVVFETVDFNLIGDKVLMFEGDNYFGTIIKGSSIPAGSSSRDYATRPISTTLGPNEASTWLITNFGTS